MVNLSVKSNYRIRSYSFWFQVESPLEIKSIIQPTLELEATILTRPRVEPSGTKRSLISWI